MRILRISSLTILIFFIFYEVCFSMKLFSDLSRGSKPPNFNVYRIILKTPCLSNQFYDLTPLPNSFYTSPNYTPFSFNIRAREVTIPVLTAAILSPTKPKKTGTKITLFYFYFILLFMFSNIVSFGLHDLFLRMLSTTFM